MINATGVSTITGPLDNTGGTINLASGANNHLNTTGTFSGNGTLNVGVDLSTAAGSASTLNTTGNSGMTTVKFTDVGGPVVLSNTLTPVIINAGATGTLQANAGAGSSFGLVNVTLAPIGNGSWDLVRTANVGAIAAPAAGIMAAFTAFDASFHQSDPPFVASPQSPAPSSSPFVASPESPQPDKWTGGIWSRAGTGQVTTKTTAFDGLTGLPAALRVKTNYDAYEVGIDTGGLNLGGSGWNGHFGVMAGAITATADETLAVPGTHLKFDVPFAGIYGVLTKGPFFADLTLRHDWADVKVTNVAANLADTDLKGHGTSIAGSAGYHFDFADRWFVEPSAGLSLSQTQFDTLPTNVGQTGQGIAAGTISFGSMFSTLVHGGARFGTSFVVGDKLALQPFGTLSVWRELGGQLNATFAQPGISDPVAFDRVGTFYQAGLGVAAQVLQTNLFGFARGDIRWGDRLDGASVVGGLRYNFAP